MKNFQGTNFRLINKNAQNHLWCAYSLLVSIPINIWFTRVHDSILAVCIHRITFRPEPHLKPSRISTVELSTKIVNGF